MSSIANQRASAPRQRQISGIIVTYRPDLETLEKVIAAVLPQVDRLIVVNNGNEENIQKWLSMQSESIEYISLGDNFGIAKAQNVGISRAKKYGSEYVLLLDQDSIPGAGMVETLKAAAIEKQMNGIAVACLGPRYDDPRQHNAIPFIRIAGYRVQRQSCSVENDVVNVDYLIASGSLIPIDTINQIGGMNEDLFIDYVDIEWGLRAQKNGFQSFGVCSALMKHQLGEEPLLFFGRHVPVHNPLRHYYHFRNAVWLYKQDWLRSEWKVVDAYRLGRKFVFYSLITKPRLKHLSMMSLGIYHGILNRMGRLDQNS
ncbi:MULTISPECIES: glycosyltransferase family 2 protein [Brucella]|jgi:rhamnosyltransferase|uniref:glycosyltransferase family 2 protein n=1 Tax=Brucella TaxID=234 RepID=UPI001292C846|nr:MULTISPECIES: glycosyltransferase family 2 protein [Brucella]